MKKQRIEESNQTIQSNPQEMVWERCCELYLQGINGNNESLKELEEICQNNQNDAVCLGYFHKTMKDLSEKKYQNEMNQISQQISENTPNLESNSSFKQFIQNLSNKHQQFMFGYFYQHGIGVEENEGKYFRLMKLSADQGHVLAEFEMGDCDFYGIEVQNNKWAFQSYLRSAMKGYSIAQYQVGECYRYGDGVDKDESLSLEWFKKSAEQGFSLGCFNLGKCHFLGIGTEVNEEEGLRWFQLSADKEHWEGLLMMGELYHYGRIVEKDRNKSFQFFEIADLHGSCDAKNYLSLHYLQSSNQTKGFQILNEDNYLDGNERNLLGLCFEFGLGVEKNENEAFKVYSEASYFPPAGYNVGRCYEEGIGFDVNFDEARRLFEESAKGKDRYEGIIDAKNKLREFEEDKVRMRFRKRQLTWMRK